MKCSSFLLLNIVLCLLTQNGIGRFLLVKVQEESDPVEPGPVEPGPVKPGPVDPGKINFMINAKDIVIFFLCFLFLKYNFF